MNMESNSNADSSSESGVLLIASILTSLKRVPSFKKIVRLFNSNSSSSKYSSRKDGAVKMKVAPAYLYNVYSNGGRDESFDSNRNENVRVNQLKSMVDGKSNIASEDNRPCDASTVEPLCKVTDVPSYLQFNPFILTGYRHPCMTSYDCLKSLLYFHNETINIMTHGE